MKITLNKEAFSNGIKIVEKSTAQKGIQPVLSNILIETVANDKIRFCATDLNQSITLDLKAEVEKEGKITLGARKLNEIASRLQDKPIVITVDEDTNIVSLVCDKSKFEMNSIGAEEYLQIFKDNEIEDENEKIFEINKDIFNKAIKQTMYCCAQSESASILGGVCVNIGENTLEVAATDGNRLTRVIKAVNSKSQEGTFIIPLKTLQEIARISSIVEDENIIIKIKKSKIYFLFNNLKFSSKLIEGTYPKYQQLIPTTNDKKIKINREKLINSIERVAIMVNERTNIIKFMFEENNLIIKADAPEAGVGSDELEIDYNYEDIVVAFNYKYVLEALKNMETENIVVEIATSLSATIFKPENNDEQVCLIMPVQVR
ncbi:MAG: DNA polymerase III subunit beta [Cyanobacteria bacterium SIG30]|nr:DNA polymerase III subunit beta [Cyanobacteria bacterium SIG30]